MRPARPSTIALILLYSFLLGACNMPGRDQPPTSSAAGAIYTAAAETMQAQLTEVSRPPVTGAAETAVPPTSPGVTPPTQGITPSPVANTTPVSGTATAVPCDRAAFDRDVTVPDNTDVDPGAAFVKTWRLQNTGSCTWNSAYAVIFSGGDSMSAPASVPLTTGSVAPGEKVDVSVNLTAPAESGTYRGEFKLRNASNQVFGVGDDAKTFWVQIEVGGGSSSGLPLDFISQATAAEWVSGAGDDLDTPLEFGGADDDPKGTAKVKDGVQLETGATSGKILLTFPNHTEDGVISGTFPAYTVRRGDRLRGRLGFMKNPDGACGAGEVEFQISYKEGDALHSLREWSKSCDGKFAAVDIDLSSLRGKSVQFVLTVRASDSFEDDWAIWNSLRIER